MTLPASGVMTTQMINIEMGRAENAAFSMNDASTRLLAGVPSGSYSFTNFYGKTFERVAVVTGNTNELVMRNYFSADDWNANIPKRLIINGGVVIGTGQGSWSLIPAHGSGASDNWNGSLTLENHGDIRGIGGQPNSGWGGNAIWMHIPTRDNRLMIINNYGAIRGGGGAGGIGGQGGTGYTHDYRYEGMQINQGWIHWGANWNISPRRSEVFCGAAILSNQTIDNGNLPSEVVIGAYRYYRGNFSHSANGRWEYSYVARQLVNPDTYYHAGGGGGNGGRGQGHDGGNNTGNGGAGGGPNAGSGGQGGTGGTWGAYGNTGANGNGGNAAGGAGGGGGGPSGAYIRGINRVQLNNYGTVQGRTENM